MTTKSVPQTLIEQIVDSSANVAKKLLPIVHGRQRLDGDDKALIIDTLKQHRDIVTEAINDCERRLKISSAKPESQQKQEPAKTIETVVLNADNGPIIPKQADTTSQLELIETGLGFKGTSCHVAKVPVESKPVLHESQRCTWSWRTTVAGHPGYRHISVSKLYQILRDRTTGQYYVLVDASWQTDQPVFSEACNKPLVDDDLANYDAMDIPF